METYPLDIAAEQVGRKTKALARSEQLSVKGGNLSSDRSQIGPMRTHRSCAELVRSLGKSCRVLLALRLALVGPRQAWRL